MLTMRIRCVNVCVRARSLMMDNIIICEHVFYAAEFSAGVNGAAGRQRRRRMKMLSASKSDRQPVRNRNAETIRLPGYERGARRGQQIFTKPMQHKVRGDENFRLVSYSEHILYTVRVVFLC